MDRNSLGGLSPALPSTHVRHLSKWVALCWVIMHKLHRMVPLTLQTLLCFL